MHITDMTSLSPKVVRMPALAGTRVYRASLSQQVYKVLDLSGLVASCTPSRYTLGLQIYFMLGLHGAHWAFILEISKLGHQVGQPAPAC
jgi:hypothetical protein